MAAFVRVHGTQALTTLAIRKELCCYGTIVSVQPDKGDFIVKFLSSASVPAKVESTEGTLSISVCDGPTVRQPALEGTIYSQELNDCNEAELLEELGGQATKVERLPTRGNIKNSGRFLLKFANSIPSEVKLDCGLILAVRVYVRMPLRCRNCLIYGHHEENCSSPSKHCTRCGKPEHAGQDCTPFCPNCLGPHEVSSPHCRAYVREVEAKRLRITEGVSRETALSRIPLLGPQSYSQAAAQTVANVTQQSPPQHPPPQHASRDDALIDLLREQTEMLRLILNQTQPHSPQQQPPPQPQSPQNAELIALMTTQSNILKQIVEQNGKLISSVDALTASLKDPQLQSSSPKRVRRTAAVLGADLQTLTMSPVLAPNPTPATTAAAKKSKGKN